VSIVLLGISVWIRLSLNESPAFQKMKAEGKTSKAPLSRELRPWKNLKIVLLALFGLTAGQAVVWYTGQFYALFFLTQRSRSMPHRQPADRRGAADRHAVLHRVRHAVDKIGRKPIIMAGCLIAALTYFPLFKALTHAANPALEAAASHSPVTVAADPSTARSSSIRSARRSPAPATSPRAPWPRRHAYANRSAAAGSIATIHIGDRTDPRLRRQPSG
jgi:hypothetical protein